VALDISLEQSHKANDSCASDGQLDGQDDSACGLVSRSNNVKDLTLHHSGDTCEDSIMAAPRHEEDRNLCDPPLDVDIRSCIGDNDPPMELSVTHSLPSQSLMLDTTHEDSSGILDVVEEPCVVIEHKGHVDLQVGEERQGLETDDYIHTYQYGESKSPLFGSPLIDQVVETDMSMGYLLLGPVYNDKDAFLVCRDGHITSMDTSVWDPGANDISRLSA
jgi:hypothetical protein